MASSRNKAKEKRAGLKIQQIDDLNATLEHLIAVGASVQQEQQRQEDFVHSMQQPLQQQHQQWVQQPPTTDERSPKKQRVHVEDIRIYGESGIGRQGFQRCPWPERSKPAPPSERLDDRWNAEHGDSVHPIAFSKARISGKRPSSQADADLINGSNLHLSTTDVTLLSEQVPRALLLRCWERAVHASSCYVTSNWSDVYHQQAGDAALGLGEPESFGFASKATEALERPPYIAQNDIVASDPKATQEKCKSLKLDLKQTSGSSSSACPVCTRAFNTFQQLHEHYYGNGQERGCCWHRVSDAQSQVVASVFEAHTMYQVDGFLSVLLREARRRNEAGTGEASGDNKRRRLLNWYDVLKIGEKVMDDANTAVVPTSPTGSVPHSHPILETYLPANASGLPLTLNPTVLATVRERLIQRYSDTPL